MSAATKAPAPKKAVVKRTTGPTAKKASPKKAAKKAARRGKAEEQANLNLTSLMDVVSIIVVYLLKSYASDPVVINPTAGQKIPLSTADAPMQDGIPIFITRAEGQRFSCHVLPRLAPPGKRPGPAGDSYLDRLKKGGSQ